MLALMSALFAGSAALHIAPVSHGYVKPSVAPRAAVLKMDEETESYTTPFSADVTPAAEEIKEVLAPQGFMSDDAAAKAAWMAKTYGTPAPMADATPPPENLTPEEEAKRKWLAARARPSWGPQAN